MSRPAPRPRRRSGHARPPRRPLRQRLRGRVPSAARVLAVLLFASLVGGLVTLVNGPWLRVGQLAWAGEHFTPQQAIDELVRGYRGAPLLTVDTGALEERLRELPAVADARVRAELPDRLRITIAEKEPALTWLTPAARLVLATDGTVVGRLPRDLELPEALAPLPAVDDQRPQSRRLDVGDSVPGAELRAARRLLALEPAALGSAATRLFLRIDAQYGFILVSRQPAWRAAMGFYQLDPRETEAAAAARLEEQVSAVRTLFAAQAEASVTWVDARNPGKVYWAP